MGLRWLSCPPPHRRDAPTVSQGAPTRPPLSFESVCNRGGECPGRLLAHCRRARSRRPLRQFACSQGALEPAARDAGRAWLSIYAPLGFLFPLDIILLVLFPATVPKAWADIKRAFSPAAWTGSEPDWPLLTLHITIGGFLLLCSARS